MAEDNLVRQLRNSFRYLDSATKTFIDTAKHSEDNLSSLFNLSEQYHCCKTADFQVTSLKNFPQIKSRTLCKIQSIMENHIANMQQELSILKSSYKQVAKHCDLVMQSCNQYAKEHDMDDITLDHVMRPSYAVMIEMLSDLNDLFHFEYLKRWQALNDVDYSKPETVDAMCKTWRDCDHLEERVNEALAQVQFFVVETS